ncbi:Hsp20/alpha crystallin family protein [candidate division KSB1 bacterium]|nr:Hsp20/alpha crystallin family protein [candidate division KSB1 bacterium]NIR70992.1 Hsp20/alpha crystallin family protein [candidate division KSB1 bacterium]NIS24733.1 Hsp20/alpha crystallin family protein [candidate division KSB1 bacterium]NIT71637.1 Hsp20/alpha crystallin family protein [candidate division KSB1 bacterium]NIU25344.1 Hsp20/alpha crystallin family protein [candidate division KSB1 bacterium]
MAIVKRLEDRPTVDRPWNAMERFFDEMWRTPFSRFLRTPSLFDTDTEWFGWHPMADIEETDDSYLIRMDLPGMKKKDIHVSIDNNVLTIEGERKRDEKSKDENYRIMERFYGKFNRSFTLPSSVDVKSVDAEFKDGVLVVNLKKKEESKPKAIEIH